MPSPAELYSPFSLLVMATRAWRDWQLLPAVSIPCVVRGSPAVIRTDNPLNIGGAQALIAMQLLALGLNHRTAPLAVRERIAVTGDGFGPALLRLRERVSEGFMLSTCNRTEYYAVVGHAESGTVALRDVLLAGSGLTPDDIAPHLDVHSHEDAVRHLFRVAAGLESMVPGEDQILAQIKGALERASQVGLLHGTAHRLGACALAAGKRVRARTGIGRHSVSVVSVALRRVDDELGGLRGRRVVVIGAGDTAELALKHLASRDVASVTIVNRHVERAASLASAYARQHLDWEALDRAVADADVVVSCTSGSGFVLTAEAIIRSRGDAGNPLFLLDLAVPRDIEPAAARLQNVRLLDFDSIETICSENRGRRVGELHAAEQITDSEVARFMAWWGARELSPTISALVGHAATLRNAELERLMARLPELSEQEEQAIRAFASRLVQKLLHKPLTVLKQDPEGANMAQVVRTLFALEERENPHLPNARVPVNDALSVANEAGSERRAHMPSHSDL